MKKSKKVVIGWTYKNWVKEFGYKNETKTEDREKKWFQTLTKSKLILPPIVRNSKSFREGRASLLHGLPNTKIRITIEEV